MGARKNTNLSAVVSCHLTYPTPPIDSNLLNINTLLSLDSARYRAEVLSYLIV